MPDDILVMNVTVKTNVSVGHIQSVTINPIRSIPPDIEAILNITHREKGEDYDYDYGERLLPPSLPNVRWLSYLDPSSSIPSRDFTPRNLHGKYEGYINVFFYEFHNCDIFKMHESIDRCSVAQSM